MSISESKRARIESRARGALREAFSGYRSEAMKGSAQRWTRLENSITRELGPVVLDAQLESAIDMVRRNTTPDILRSKGWPEQRIQAAQERVDAKIAEWRGGGFPARPTNIMTAATQIVRVTKSRWQSLRARFGTRRKIPRKDLREFVRVNYGKSRADRIATTEITTALSDGEAIAKRYLSNTFKSGWTGIWQTQEDEKVCFLCGPLHETPQTVWKRVAYRGPPAHVNCRCYIEWIATS